MDFEQQTGHDGYEKWMIHFTPEETAKLEAAEKLKRPKSFDQLASIAKLASQKAFEQDIPPDRVHSGLPWERDCTFREIMRRSYEERAREWSLPDRVFRNADQRAWHHANGKDMDAVTSRAESNPPEFLRRILAQAALLELDETQKYETHPKHVVQSIEATIDIFGPENLLQALATQPSN